MARRGSPDVTPISFFSFQDIITTVTGIMILTVLLLIMELLDRKIVEQPPPPAKEKEHPQDIDALRKDVETKSRGVDRMTGLLKDLGQSTPAVAKDRLRTSRAEVAAFASETGDLKSRIDILRNRLPERLQERQALEREKERLKTAPSLQDRVLFVSERKNEKTPILAECSRQQIKTEVLDDASTRKTYATTSSGNILAMIEQFDAWLKSRNRATEYVVLIVKPSASPYFNAIVSTVQANGFELGYEPLEEAKTTIEEERK